jgi:aspartate/methionine/tyrosine aminotransferase
MKEFNLGWGNAVCVRQAFLEGLDNRIILFPLNDTNLNYTPHDGDPLLIDITRRVIERQVGPTYKHIFLTNGAAGGVTIALRAYAQQGYKTAYTRPAPYFPIYPAMIGSAGLKHVYGIPYTDCLRPVFLVDSPANPTGEIEPYAYPGRVIIWDAVYHSRVYTNGNEQPIKAEAVIGSYSKLLGLNGIRTGWVATNDDLLAERLKSLVTAEYCGLSSASNAVLLNVLRNGRSKYFWENFENKARTYLDNNRTEWSKLEKYFDDTPVVINGMFYFSHADKKCQELLTKASVVWTTGSSLGVDDTFVRINLGQDCKLVREAVKAVLKADKI